MLKSEGADPGPRADARERVKGGCGKKRGGAGTLEDYGGVQRTFHVPGASKVGSSRIGVNVTSRDKNQWNGGGGSETEHAKRREPTQNKRKNSYSDFDKVTQTRTITR